MFNSKVLIEKLKLFLLNVEKLHFPLRDSFLKINKNYFVMQAD